jgi:ABC-2 type transport system permease protein
VSRSTQVALLSRRSILGIVRQPGAWVPPIVFPLMFAALSSAAFARSINLPGFPKVDSFLDFMMATAIMQGVLFGSGIGGTDMAIDIQDGFFDRLVASPVARSSILLGRLAGAATLGLVQAVVFSAVFIAFGASIKGGVASFVGIVVVATMMAVALGGFSLTLALRTGSSEAVQASFPVFFILMFLSSAFFPRQLMRGWFRSAANLNPLSWLIESLRHLVIVDFSFTELGRAIAIALGLGVVSLTLASRSLQRRLAAG